MDASALGVHSASKTIVANVGYFSVFRQSPKDHLSVSFFWYSAKHFSLRVSHPLVYIEVEYTWMKCLYALADLQPLYGTPCGNIKPYLSPPSGRERSPFFHSSTIMGRPNHTVQRRLTISLKSWMSCRHERTLYVHLPCVASEPEQMIPGTLILFQPRENHFTAVPPRWRTPRDSVVN